MSIILKKKKHNNFDVGSVPHILMVVKGEDNNLLYATNYSVSRAGRIACMCEESVDSARLPWNFMKKGLYVPMVIDEDLDNPDESNNYAYRVVFFSKKELQKNSGKYRLFGNSHNNEMVRRLVAKYGFRKMQNLGFAETYLQKVMQKSNAIKF